MSNQNGGSRYWVGGRLHHRDEPGDSPFDSLVRDGETVWESLRLYDGRVLDLDAHVARLRRTAAALRFAPLPAEPAVTSALAETIAANGMRDGVHVRLVLTHSHRLPGAGCILVVLADRAGSAYAAPGLRLATATVRHPTRDPLDLETHRASLLSSALARTEAVARGADDVLVLDARGAVAVTDTTDLFAVVGGRLMTQHAVVFPEGVARRTVLELAAGAGVDAAVRDLSLADLHAAEEVFCVGSVGEVAAVARIDDGRVGGAGPGPVTARLGELYRDRVRRRGVPLTAGHLASKAGWPGRRDSAGPGRSVL